MTIAPDSPSIASAIKAKYNKTYKIISDGKWKANFGEIPVNIELFRDSKDTSAIYFSWMIDSD